MRGFTLLEILAVVVLLTMAMAATAGGFAGADDAARLRAACAGVLDLEQRARLDARAGGTIVLALDRQRLTLVAESGEQLAGLELPRALTVRLIELRTGSTVPSIAFDRTGCSPDYLVTLTGAAGTRQLRIAGLTGWSEDEGGPTP